MRMDARPPATLEIGGEVPREFVSKDDLTKKLKKSLEAEGLGDVGLGPVRKMIEIGLSGENWWVNVIKSSSPNLRRDAEDVISRHQKGHSVERRTARVERRTARVGRRASVERSRPGGERRGVIRRGAASAAAPAVVLVVADLSRFAPSRVS